MLKHFQIYEKFVFPSMNTTYSINNHLYDPAAHYYLCFITIISTLVLFVIFCCFAITVGICYHRNRKEARQKRKRKEVSNIFKIKVSAISTVVFS